MLKEADDEFAANLHVTARSLLLYRIAGSSDREAELAFLSKVIGKILEESGRPSEAEHADQVLNQDVARKSVGELFSSTTDVLDTLSPREIYKLLSRLRSEPVHSKPFSDVEEIQEARQTPDFRFQPSAQPTVELPTPRDYDFDVMKAQHVAPMSEEEEAPSQSTPDNVPEVPEKVQVPDNIPEAPVESPPEKIAETPEKITETPEKLPETPEKIAETPEKIQEVQAEKIQEPPAELPEEPAKLQEASEKVPETIPEEAQKTETAPAPEPRDDGSLQGLVEEIRAGNAKIDELTSDLVATKQRLESFEKSYDQNNKRLELLKKELSRVPGRLEEIEENLTSIVRDSIDNGT